MERHLGLHENDALWAADFALEATLLDDNGEGQLALWPMGDLLGPKRYVSCPQRGTHFRLTDCWMCWCDVAYGDASAQEVLRDGDV